MHIHASPDDGRTRLTQTSMVQTWANLSLFSPHRYKEYQEVLRTSLYGKCKNMGAVSKKWPLKTSYPLLLLVCTLHYGDRLLHTQNG